VNAGASLVSAELKAESLGSLFLDRNDGVTVGGVVYDEERGSSTVDRGFV
jgi:hypothetical protein